MTQLEQAWRQWRSLWRPDRARFLVMLREAYSREREATVRANGGGAHGATASSLGQLTLTEADLQRLRL